RPFSDRQVALLQNFAAQAVIAMENARLLTETREALEQQTATAEVLQVINSSPGDLTPVFDAILEKAHALCHADHGHLTAHEGGQFRALATHGVPEVFAKLLRQPFRPGLSVAQRLRAGESVIQFTDMATYSYDPDDQIGRGAVELAGARTLLIVAMRKDDDLFGYISAHRTEVRPFSEKEIALLQNFATQAVIAMENARLINETREALEQQTATSEVLRVINASPGDLAPVFDAILGKAHALCEASFGALMTYDDEQFRPVAVQGAPTPFREFIRQGIRPRKGDPFRLIVEGAPLAHIHDLAEVATQYPKDPLPRAAVDLGGIRTLLIVPLRKDGALLGVITAYRQEVRPFSEKQIGLLQNFAAQAVIAMENARLITELRQRTRDLQGSLDYQTAISDVLKVISRSAFDLQTVLQAVATAAARLCRADSATIYRNEGGEYCWAAGYMLSAAYEIVERVARIRPGTGTVVGRAVMEGRTVQVLDAWTDPLYEAKDDARAGGVHTMIGVPLLRENAPIGAIGLLRRRIEAFSEREIALVTTFADQAVIAIENARLIEELRDRTADLGRSVEELKMLGRVGQAVSSTLDLKAVLSTILTASLGVTMANAGAVFRYIRTERAFRLVEAAGLDDGFAGSVRELRVAEAETAMHEAMLRRMPVQLSDLAERPSAPLRDAALAAGFRSTLIVPLVGAERVFGAITLMRREAGEFPPETVRLMQTLASQSVLAIQNARLFREIADKSEQLALASQHKSQFLANMSHELRTPLNAILGYAELLVDGIYGALPEKAQGVLERVQNNGKHLLALINDVLDLAKIEAGQLTLTLEDYALPEVVRAVVGATEPLAAAKGLKFVTAIEDGLPMAHGDARRVSQVLLNLIGNAVKFTDEGEVEVSASLVNGQFVLSVRDTGPGIADADQERIFGEFQQIDNSDTRKKGGTGLGLAISKRMVEMQGGMISVDSVLGEGSTFRVILPVHVEPALEEAA
ncbi:MAG TPA: GAF domain-containing protein, partial [Stellaceae bacterium]|nr:GAF domain-containing protein [Stellaceae bacterium]